MSGESGPVPGTLSAVSFPLDEALGFVCPVRCSGVASPGFSLGVLLNSLKFFKKRLFIYLSESTGSGGQKAEAEAGSLDPRTLVS